MERHEKWVRVEAGTTIPAGQPYRVERKPVELTWNMDQEVTPDRCEDSDWFVDSSWKPPLVLPTEPGSVILARANTDAVTVLMFLLDKDSVSGALDRFWVDITGAHWDASEIVSAETIYDAGAER